jgi:hypothetical protein
MPRTTSAIDRFRRIALGHTGAVEQAHHGHPDFRAYGRIFATLGYPDQHHGMVALTPDQQQHYIRSHSDAFEPVAGTWGLQGATLVRLSAVDEETLGEAMDVAFQNARAKGAKTTTRTRTPAKRTAKKRRV